jgi:hypothetical protein
MHDLLTRWRYWLLLAYPVGGFLVGYAASENEPNQIVLHHEILVPLIVVLSWLCPGVTTALCGTVAAMLAWTLGFGVRAALMEAHSDMPKGEYPFAGAMLIIFLFWVVPYLVLYALLATASVKFRRWAFPRLQGR